MIHFIHTNEHKIKKYYIGAIICSILSVYIYVWSLLSASNNIFLFNCDIGGYYIFQYFYIGVFCILGNMFYKNKVKKRYLVMISGVALTLYCFIINNVFYYDYLYAIKELCLSLWPMFTYFLGIKIVAINQKKRKPQCDVFRIGIYFLLLTVAICLIENKLVFSEFYRRDPVEMFFMIAVGIASWIIIVKQYRIEKNTLALVICSILCFLATFWNHERISNIISSLINPISSVPIDNLHTDNWMGYRMSLSWNAWFGDMSPFLDDTFYFNVDNCSLFWIKYQKGWLPFIVAFLAGILLLYFVARISMSSNIRKNSFAQILLVSIFSLCALGYLAELFLITSTDIGALLLRNPGEILLLWMLFGFALGDDKYEVESNRKRIAKD